MKEWQELEGMPHYITFYMKLRIIQESNCHILQILGHTGWTDLLVLDGNDSINRLKNYAKELFIF